MRQDGSWEVLKRQDEADELRVVAMREMDDGSLQVEERTDGELTFLTYGALTCVRSVTMAGDALEAAAWALGPEGRDARAAVRAFFSGQARFLSDLQDVLDAGGVSYAYQVSCGNDYVLRRYGE